MLRIDCVLIVQPTLECPTCERTCMHPLPSPCRTLNVFFQAILVNQRAEVSIVSDHSDEETHENDEPNQNTPNQNVTAPPPIPSRAPGFQRTSHAINQLGKCASKLVDSLTPSKSTPQCPPHCYRALESAGKLFCERCADIRDF